MPGLEFQTDGATKLKERSSRDFRLRFGTFKSLSLENRSVRDVSDVFRAKPDGRVGVYGRSDGRQELWSCVRSGISQAASGVRLAVVLHGLAFVSPSLNTSSMWRLCTNLYRQRFPV